MTIKIICINSSNVGKYKPAVLSWLRKDYQKQNKRPLHFWHNKDIIEKAFDDHHALVMINYKQEVIGYLIWNVTVDLSTLIMVDIIEIREDYRKKGLSKEMFKELIEKFPEVCALSCSPLPQAVSFFNT